MNIEKKARFAVEKFRCTARARATLYYRFFRRACSSGDRRTFFACVYFFGCKYSLRDTALKGIGRSAKREATSLRTLLRSTKRRLAHLHSLSRLFSFDFMLISKKARFFSTKRFFFFLNITGDCNQIRDFHF